MAQRKIQATVTLMGRVQVKPISPNGDSLPRVHEVIRFFCCRLIDEKSVANTRCI